MLLAAGLGTRLRPITNSIPKCLVPINGKPLLGYWLDTLNNAGITQVLVNLHYLENCVKAFIKSLPEQEGVQTVYEPVLLGTAGTIRKNSAFTGSSGPIMVIHADNLCLSNLRVFVNAHRDRPIGTAITMMTFLTDNPKDCGVVELDDRNVVTSFQEKIENPSGNLANGAVYVFEQSVIDWISSQNREYLDISKDVLPQFIGKIFTWPADGLHIDIGSPASLKKANSIFDQQRKSMGT